MAGRTTAARSQTGVGTTSGGAGLTGPSGTFVVGGDVGAPITGTGIPAGATLLSVTSSTVATLSANATATGTVTVVVGPELPGAAGFVGFLPETGLQQNGWTFASLAAGGVPADVLTDSVTRVTQPVSP